MGDAGEAEHAAGACLTPQFLFRLAGILRQRDGGGGSAQGVAPPVVEFAVIFIIHLDAVDQLQIGNAAADGGDALDPEWRLVAAIEGVNGIILLGWSTAFFVTGMRRLGRL